PDAPVSGAGKSESRKSENFKFKISDRCTSDCRCPKPEARSLLLCRSQSAAPRQPFIKLDIFLRRMSPRMIGAHPCEHQRAPKIAVGVHHKRFVNFLKQARRIIFIELESVAALRAAVKILYRIVKPADCAHNWRRAILERIHLIQPARLEPGRH